MKRFLSGKEYFGVFLLKALNDTLDNDAKFP